MSDRLQEFGLDASTYERANRPWHCGHRAGAPCSTGPDARGRCGGRAACVPTRDADGAAPRCGRLKEYGGRCSAGPTAEGHCSVTLPPCRPVASVRTRRGSVVRWTFALTLGLLLLALFGPLRDGFVDPGELSDPHRRLGLDCAACHGAAETSAIGWAAWALRDDVDASVAARCGHCHRFPQQAVPLNPHGMSEAHLREARAAAGGGREDWNVPTLRCGTCHAEHEGREHRLVPTTSEDCHTCHVRRFTSFQRDHPPFPERWPHARRNPVAFDHKAHYGGLFAQGVAAIKDPPQGWRAPRCTTCHAPDSGGRDMRPRFEAHCDLCHGSRMSYDDASADGVALRFLQIPWFDEGARPEGWPEDRGCMDPSEVRLSATLQILLGKDRASYVRLMERMPEDDRGPEGFLEMGEEASGEVGAFLASLERLVRELGAPDRSTVLASLARRFREALDVTLTPEQEEELWPPALQERAGEALRAWFQPEAKPPEPEDTAGHDPKFVVSSESFSLDLVPRYERDVPDSHHGDATLRAWIPFVLRFLDRQRPLTGDEATHRLGPGIQRCLKCHNVDRDATGRLDVDWTGHRRAERLRLDRFDHAPHLGQDMGPAPGEIAKWAQLRTLSRNPVLRNCLTCHVATEADAHDDFFLHTFTGTAADASPDRTDPAGARGNFGPIGRARCATCHGGGRARSDCLSCHRYHAGEHSTQAAMDAAPPPKPSARR